MIELTRGLSHRRTSEVDGADEVADDEEEKTMTQIRIENLQLEESLEENDMRAVSGGIIGILIDLNSPPRPDENLADDTVGAGLKL